MKTIKILFAASILSVNLFAGNENRHGDKYCAKVKDGKLTVMYQGAEITSDVMLTDGSTVKKDGTVLKKDGSIVMLKSGECIDKDGKMVKENSKDGKMRNDSTQKNKKELY